MSPRLPRRPCSRSSDLKKHFPVRKGLLRRTVGHVYAVDGVSFTIGAGETLGLVGESRLRQDHGRPRHPAPDRADRRHDPARRHATSPRLGKAELRPYRRQMQIIFQDPFSSLNPRMTAGDIVGEPLQVHGVPSAQGARASGSRRCSSASACGRRRWATIPHQFSGGQRQRIGIARALALEPEADHRRRAGVGARRVDPGAGHQPAAWTCSASCGSPTCSSRTTSRWWSTSATASP